LKPLPNASCHTRCDAFTPYRLSMYASSYHTLYAATQQRGAA
jgi:hypothetical protein